MSGEHEFAVGRFPDRVEVTLTGRWTADAGRLIESGEADRLVLNYAHGFSEPDLGFLRGLPVRQLDVVDRRLTSLTPISELGDTLEWLRITSDPALAIDLTRLPKLTDLSADWQQLGATIESAARLQRLHIGRYDGVDLAPLCRLVHLRRLVLMDRPRVRSLDGLSELPELQEFAVPLAKDLVDVSALRGLAQLEDLDLEACRKLNTIEDLSQCVGLRRLNLSECGDLPSVAPLRGLTSIEDLLMYGTTKVVDGDLTPIADLPRLRELRMQSRRHYRPSVAEIQAEITRG
ncbi:hypothetical protein [Nocardioides speluncae]|uniref:hypothetical protein n=1 Tax=Nocardioides speluncae TaxID=2670337 RepID=UPI000D69D282|nr:hypothetical protein [Nocardioides speluncae]